MDIPDTAENAAACLCANCPSKVADDLTFYCVKGHSSLPVTRGFCACRWCPLWSCYGLANDFFCDAAARDGVEAREGNDAPDDASAPDGAGAAHGADDENS